MQLGQANFNLLLGAPGAMTPSNIMNAPGKITDSQIYFNQNLHLIEVNNKSAFRSRTP
jgi:hypothetical protein